MADISRFQRLAVHLAEGCTLREAAERAGVPERSAYRAAANEKFRRLVKRCRSRMWRSLAGKLTAACEDAVTALRQLATDAESPATARVAAARGILEAALRFRDAQDVERRLTALEGKIEPCPSR